MITESLSVGEKSIKGERLRPSSFWEQRIRENDQLNNSLDGCPRVHPLESSTLRTSATPRKTENETNRKERTATQDLHRRRDWDTTSQAFPDRRGVDVEGSVGGEVVRVSRESRGGRDPHHLWKTPVISNPIERKGKDKKVKRLWTHWLKDKISGR